MDIHRNNQMKTYNKQAYENLDEIDKHFKNIHKTNHILFL